MAFALKPPYVPADKSFAVTGGVGLFNQKSAFAASAGYRVTSNVQLDAGLAVGFDSGEVGSRAGITVTW